METRTAGATDLPGPQQPAATRDGVPLTPLAGGFLPPYTDRLHLVQDLPALDAADLTSHTGASPFSPAARQAMAAWSAPFGPPEETHALTEDLQVEGPHGPVPVRIYRPEPRWQAPRPSPATGQDLRAGLVWLHGGGFTRGDLDMPEADAVARGLATRTGAIVVSVAYRLCDDATHHPVPHDDAYAAFLWTVEHATGLGIDPARVAVGGASAGGAIAASVALHGRDDGAAPWQVLLAYPVVHAEHWPAPSAELAERLADMPQILRFPPEVMAVTATSLLGGPAKDVPAYAFPGESTDLAGYPPTYIESCENDDLRASGEAFARQLAQAGTDVESVTCAGVPHGFLNDVGSPLTAASLDRLAARLARQA